MVGNILTGGDGSESSLAKDMPLASDLANISKELYKYYDSDGTNGDLVGAMNDVLNLLVQSGLGVNPQSLTDMAVAVMDYCGDDAQTARECALLVSRIVNCPQSQIDKIYFDEIDMSGEEAQDCLRLAPEKIAERYAEYKLLRNASLTGWAYDSEGREKVLEKHRKRARSEMKSRLDSKVNTERTRELLERCKEDSKREKALLKLLESDPEGYQRGMQGFRREVDMARHRRLKRYSEEIKRLTKRWQGAKSAAEADSIVERMVEARDRMLEDVDSLASLRGNK